MAIAEEVHAVTSSKTTEASNSPLVASQIDVEPHQEGDEPESEIGKRRSHGSSPTRVNRCIETREESLSGE